MLKTQTGTNSPSATERRSRAASIDLGLGHGHQPVKEPRDGAIETIKAVAIIGVVLHHISNRRMELEAREIISVINATFSWCVLLFIAVSGWLHAQSEERKRRSIAEFVSCRCRRLLLPFVCLVCLYAVAWEGIEALGVMQLSGNVSGTFSGKLGASFWPLASGIVAEQLYFFLLLFLVSIPVHVMYILGGCYAVACAAIVAFLVGAVAYAGTRPTGFSFPVAVFGIGCYAAGFVFFVFRRRTKILTSGAIGFALAGCIWDLRLAPKIFPLLVLAMLSARTVPSVRWLLPVGAASGTVFAYHTPFILQPIVILSSCLPSWHLQLIAALSSAGIATAVCVFVYHNLRHTPAARLLV